MGKGLVSWITIAAAVGAFSELTSFGSSFQANCVFDCLCHRHLGGEWEVKVTLVNWVVAGSRPRYCR